MAFSVGWRAEAAAVAALAASLVKGVNKQSEKASYQQLKAAAPDRQSVNDSSENEGHLEGAGARQQNRNGIGMAINDGLSIKL